MPTEPLITAAADWLGEDLHDPNTQPPTLPNRLPRIGWGEPAALAALRPLTRAARRLGDAGFLAHMDPPTPPVAWAAHLWAAATNQNLLHPDTAPAARELEEQVVGWLGEVFGMGGGHLCAGSTLANLTALWAAREAGARRVVASAAAHLSVAKAAHILALPLEMVDTDRFGRLRPDHLPDLADAVLVLTAGTTASGAIDPLIEVGRAAWTHVDAAWAGPLMLSETHCLLLRGIEQADSLAVSGHKWLWQPKESAAILFRNAARQALISRGSGYLTAPNVGVQGSRSAAPAMALAATLLAWGRQGIADRLDQCMDVANALAGRVDAEPTLELRHAPQTGVVLWRRRDQDPALTRQHLQGAFVSFAVVDGEPWLRSVAAHPEADPMRVVDAVLAA
ncbi:MAG: pyridoxal-dependent decarboxylase [Planctomycetota bacterium]